MDAYTSQHLRNALMFSQEEASRLGSSAVGVEHIVLGIIRENAGTAIKIMALHGVPLTEFKHHLIARLFKSNTTSANLARKETQLPIDRLAERVIRLMYLESKAIRSKIVGTEHIMLSILKDDQNAVTSYLKSYNLDYITFKSDIVDSLTNREADEIPEIPFAKSEGDSTKFSIDPSGSNAIPNTVKSKSKTPYLDNLSRDLTALAETNRLDPVIGRDKELERVVQILCRRKKNNPVLIGEPGVGKTAIAEGLAQLVVQRKVPQMLQNKRIFSLDMGSVVAGTMFRGQFEERVKGFIAELEKNPQIILFIDEIHNIVGAGSTSGVLDASNLFKPALARGEIQFMGATTLDEYREYIEKDGALERRFQKVIVEPTNIEDTLHILEVIKNRYEEHHSVAYSDEALRACVELTSRYINDRTLPDKAIDVLDEVGARVHLQHHVIPVHLEQIERDIESLRQKKREAILAQDYEEAGSIRNMETERQEKLDKLKNEWVEETKSMRFPVSFDDVAEVVAMVSGVPVQKVAQEESLRLGDMDRILKEKVIGQDIAVEKIVRAIRRNRVGLRDPKRPIGSFIFLGSTGVGKTLLAKMLAEVLFESEHNLIRVDMSEFMEPHAITRLIGVPPGYVGHDEGGQLTERVRRKPYSIVLFDEIEKAHPDIFNILLQLLDEGFLTDSLGRRIDFKNTVVIMTSNVGSRRLSDFGQGVGFQTQVRHDNRRADAEKIIEAALKKEFSPEFLNRLDDIIIFDPLSKESIGKIIVNELTFITKRLKDINISIHITPEAKAFLIDKAWDPEYGARPLRRAIQRYIEDPITDELVQRQMHIPPFVIVSCNEDAQSLDLAFQDQEPATEIKIEA